MLHVTGDSLSIGKILYLLEDPSTGKLVIDGNRDKIEAETLWNKYISKNRGINLTGGLSILRVSPDHGTAYDIVGKDIAESKSLLNCYKFLNNF